MSKPNLEIQFDKISKTEFYIIVIVEHIETHELVGNGTLFLEPKFLTNSISRSLGHVEDIVVKSSHRKKGLGKKIMGMLTEVAKVTNCYEMVLDCSEANIPFYEIFGYKRAGVQMGKVPASKKNLVEGFADNSSKFLNDKISRFNDEMKPEGIHMRFFSRSDVGYMVENDGILVKVENEINKKLCEDFYSNFAKDPEPYIFLIIENLDSKEICGMGRVAIEQKFFKGLCEVGHIDDVRVFSCAAKNPDSLFGDLCRFLYEIASEVFSCNNVILNCENSEIGKFEKLGFEVKGISMSKKLDD